MPILRSRIRSALPVRMWPAALAATADRAQPGKVGERIEPSLVSWCGQGAGCFIAVGNDDLADHTEKRYDSFGFRPGSQAGAIGIGDGADAISAADTSDVHAIVGRHAAGFRLHGTDPKRWVWKLDGR
jgi:hypothetical protein